MEPDIAAEILVVGSRDGWFTGKKLSDYITLKASNYRGARRVINGNGSRDRNCRNRPRLRSRAFGRKLWHRAGSPGDRGPPRRHAAAPEPGAVKNDPRTDPAVDRGRGRGRGRVVRRQVREHADDPDRGCSNHHCRGRNRFPRAPETLGGWGALMGVLGKKLRGLEGGNVSFKCPGCGDWHVLNVKGDGRPRWTYNGNADAPTFSPSVNYRTGHHVSGHTGDCWCNWTDEDGEPSGFSCVICHSFVTDGTIRFLNDCTHELAGQTVDLPDLEPDP